MENKGIDENKKTDLTENEQTDSKKSSRSKKEQLKLAKTEYSEEDFKGLIRGKYREHDAYFKTLDSIVDKITEKELAPIKGIIEQLDNYVQHSNELDIKQLEKYVIKLPIIMYTLNNKLGKHGLNLDISEYLKELSVTETLLSLTGGSATERLKAAEYENMISAFTVMVKARVYQNFKSQLDYATKIYDGLKKVLSAQIEEMKLFGKDTMR